eukprot:scaffold26691_cov141-Skeletonema_menzelii.AAC.2
MNIIRLTCFATAPQDILGLCIARYETTDPLILMQQTGTNRSESNCVEGSQWWYLLMARMKLQLNHIYRVSK